MIGIIMSIVAGALMSLQGVFNTRLSEKIGLFQSNTFVQGTAFVLSLIVMFFFGKNGDFREITNVNKLYLLGGALGLGITVSVMLSIKGLSPTYAISIILISQLLIAAIIDAFGLFDSDKIPFTWNKYIGILVMIAGVLLFKWNTNK